MHRGANRNEQVILQYFERNYVGNLRAGVRMAPSFPHELWNVHDRVMIGLPRTANAVEGWHHSSKSAMSCDNLEIYWLFNTGACFDASQNCPRHFWSCSPCSKPKIQRSQRTYFNHANRNIVDFLRAISYMIAKLQTYKFYTDYLCYIVAV